jgi:hypothetical protein
MLFNSLFCTRIDYTNLLTLLIIEIAANNLYLEDGCYIFSNYHNLIAILLFNKCDHLFLYFYLEFNGASQLGTWKLIVHKKSKFSIQSSWPKKKT